MRRFTFKISSDKSKPSQTVSIIPGHGFNWVVDKWGYQIYKLTYDASQTIFRKYTDWAPHDLAVAEDKNIGLITYPGGGMYEIFDLSTGILIKNSFAISRP